MVQRFEKRPFNLRYYLLEFFFDLPAIYRYESF
jgi:hypothetical protein